MSTLPVDVVPTRGAGAAMSWLSSLPAAPSDVRSRAVLLVDKVLGFTVLALMAVAGAVIAVVTLGVLMGFIA